ncbi:MAG: iron-containing alcohol dehydrogenase [Clostridia bacterium]|nr:iron-containing alcohol dehydrogenase [Clostridia bacterium]
MDTGKGIGIVVNNPEFADIRSLEGVAPTHRRTVFTIAVPTTGGTGAESTINYVITDVEKKRKFVCVDPIDIPDIAIVDPDMMSSMPKGLTASTGMDTLTHAIEGYTTAAAWELSDCLNLEAIRLIGANLRKAAVDAARQLSVDVGIPVKLDKLKEADLPFLCESAAADACAPGNPRPASLAQFEEMFRKLM